MRITRVEPPPIPLYASHTERKGAQTIPWGWTLSGTHRTRAMMSSKLQFDFSLVDAFVVMHCIIGDLGQRGDDSMQASITAPSGRADNRGSVRVCE